MRAPQLKCVALCLVDTDELGRLQHQAVCTAWKHILLRDMLVIDAVTGAQRETDSDDETEEGIRDPYLTYVNKLWPLQLALESREGTNVLDRVILMLGPALELDAFLDILFETHLENKEDDAICETGLHKRLRTRE